MLSFYGISVPQLTLMTPNFRRLKGLVKLINNPLSGRIRETKEHALYLKGLPETFTWGYDDLQIKSLERRLVLGNSKIQSFSNPLRPDAKTKSPEEIKQEIQEIVETKGLKKELLNTFINVDGDKVTLSENSFLFLKNYLEINFPRLDSILDSCVEGVLTEINIFGRPPGALFNRPGILEYAVTEMFSKKGDGRQLPAAEIYKRLEREVSLCRSIVDSYDSTDISAKASRNDLETKCTPIAFNDFVDSRGVTSEEKGILEEKFLECNPLFIESIMEFVSKGYIRVPELNYLIDFYFEVYLLDFSDSYLKQSVGLEDYELDLDQVFHELNSIGLYYLNRDNIIHMIESLKTMILGEEEGRLNIDSEPEFGNKTFRESFRDLEYGFFSLAPSGSLIGEGEVS